MSAAESDELLRLAERVEALTGADARLEAEIDCAVRHPHLRPAEPTDFDGQYGYSPGNIKTEHGFLMSSNYTSSLDAARSLLLPDHWMRAEGVGAAWYVLVHPTWDHGLEWAPTYAAEAQTLELALTAAALRARAGQRREGSG
ncbi:hypothetical protein [Roseomonas populi]|uniref:Uncharacterized protein n=1 Tax=Roseomonas populi TaxID=3121582 RepID=A0ABT1X143_9PROT|nr:hypothetical protein [Roseomonas pecuniae]MCR0981825.1 hypothetical protein [Roseomonas pecuniae]